MNGLLKKIDDLNENGRFSEVTYRDEKVWPYLRVCLGLSFKEEKAHKIGFSKKLRVVMAGLFSYIIWILRFRKIDVFMMSAGHYKVKKGDILFDKFLYHFQLIAKEKGLTFEVADYFSDFDLPKNLFHRNQFFPFQTIILFLSLLWRIQFKFSNEKHSSSYKEFKARLFESDFKELSNLDWKLFFLIKQSKFFFQVLRRAKVKKVLVVCYYDIKGMALIKAANELGIEVMDLQHGVQGRQHVAYNGWRQEEIYNSVMFPSHFWVWSEFDQINLKQSFPNSHIIKGGNLWLTENIGIKDKNFILFTAQGLSENFPKCLLHAIKNYQGNYIWKIRLHPRQKNEITQVKEFFELHGIENKVEIIEATNLPLTELLKETAVHVTQFSTVVIESYFFNIPSIIINPVGIGYYKDQIPENFLFEAYNESAILEKLDSIQLNWTYGSGINHCDKKDYIEFINNFYNEI